MLPDADVWKWTCHRCGYFVETVVEDDMRSASRRHLMEAHDMMTFTVTLGPPDPPLAAMKRMLGRWLVWPGRSTDETAEIEKETALLLGHAPACELADYDVCTCGVGTPDAD